MSQSKKTILFNPDLLSTRKNKNKTIKKKIKPTIPSLIRPNKLRSQLINKIKDFQKRENNNENDNENEKINTNLEIFTSDFNKSIDFLENLKKDNTTKPAIQPAMQPAIQRAMQPAIQPAIQQPVQLAIQQPTQPAMQPVIQAAIQPVVSNFKILNSQAPPYSTIKNGSKPTYREWIKNKNLNNTTLKKQVNNEIKIHDKDDININTERSVKLQELKKVYKKNGSLPKKYIKKQIKTIKYKLGKIGDKVSVLIKNNETRKKIKRECGILKQTSIKDIKDYLRKHNLLKVGSIAPNDVLRKMYEQTILSGDINNKNGDTLIHNFFN
jgi:hypothetical protein